jgi:hypothetical protein
MPFILKDLRKKKNQIGLSEQPGMKEIIKIGKEINRMKSLNEPKSRVSTEYEADVHKVLNNRKLHNAIETKERIKEFVNKSLREYKE